MHKAEHHALPFLFSIFFCDKEIVEAKQKIGAMNTFNGILCAWNGNI